MDNNYTGFLVPINASLAEKQVMDKILLCNEDTKQYGLVLTERQALALSQTRTASLKENKRIEFGEGIVDKLIMAVCDSPYITQEIYEETLHELINLFYTLKNDTWDKVSDNDLIDFIRTAFNGCCHGSIDLLIEQSMRLTQHIHCGKNIKTFSLEEK
ncbi:MAG: DUF6323 family protein [Lachnospira sp.]